MWKAKRLYTVLLILGRMTRDGKSRRGACPLPEYEESIRMNSARSIRHALIAAACLVLGTPPAFAQKGDPAAGFPGRPIRVLVPFSPGGQPDLFGRLIAQKVSDALGQ